MERTRYKVIIERAVVEFQEAHPYLSEAQLNEISRFQWLAVREALVVPKAPVVYVEGWGQYEIRIMAQEKQLNMLNLMISAQETGFRTRHPIRIEFFKKRKEVLEKSLKMAIEHFKEKNKFRKKIKFFMDLVKIWRKRDEILEGWLYKAFPKIENSEAREFRQKIAEARLGICRTNKCGYYDKEGKSKAAVLKGKESCAACGCPLASATMSLAKQCGLADLGKEPMWPSVFTAEQEAEMDKKLGE